MSAGRWWSVAVLCACLVACESSAPSSASRTPTPAEEPPLTGPFDTNGPSSGSHVCNRPLAARTTDVGACSRSMPKGDDVGCPGSSSAPACAAPVELVVLEDFGPGATIIAAGGAREVDVVVKRAGGLQRYQVSATGGVVDRGALPAKYTDAFFRGETIACDAAGACASIRDESWVDIPGSFGVRAASRGCVAGRGVRCGAIDLPGADPARVWTAVSTVFVPDAGGFVSAFSAGRGISANADGCGTQTFELPVAGEVVDIVDRWPGWILRTADGDVVAGSAEACYRCPQTARAIASTMGLFYWVDDADRIRELDRQKNSERCPIALPSGARMVGAVECLSRGDRASPIAVDAQRIYRKQGVCDL